MRCKQCGYKRTEVIDTRYGNNNSSVRRRRECPHCKIRFTTYELEDESLKLKRGSANKYYVVIYNNDNKTNRAIMSKSHPLTINILPIETIIFWEHIKKDPT